MKSLLIAFVSISLSTLAQAQELFNDGVIAEDTQVRDWLVRCLSEGEGPQTCFMATNAVTAIEQRELAILSIGRVDEEDRVGEEVYAAQLTSPTFVNVRQGIALQVDQTRIATIAYEVCTSRNCISSFGLTPAMVNALSDGFAAALVFVDAEGQRVSATLSLNGFAEGLERL